MFGASTAIFPSFYVKVDSDAMFGLSRWPHEIPIKKIKKYI